MALGPSVYKLVFDTQGLDTLVASRRELALSRKLMEETVAPTERFAASWDLLNQQLNKDLISPEAHAKAFTKLKSELPENVAAMDLLNRQLQRSESVRQSLLTVEERERQQTEQLNLAIAENKRLSDEGIITKEKALENHLALNAALPENIELTREYNEIQKNGQEILRMLQTDEQRFAETRARAWEALQIGALHESEYQDLLRRSPKALAEKAAAEKSAAEKEQERNNRLREAESIKERNMTLEERLNKQLERANALRKELGEENYSRELKRINDQLPANVKSEERLAQLRKEGEQLVERLQSPTERYRSGLARLNEIHGVVGLSTEVLTRRKRELMLEMVSGIPGIGRYASMILGMNPALVAAGVAATATISIFRDLGREVSRQFELIDNTIKQSRVLGTDVGQLQALRGTAREVGGMETADFDRSLSLMRKNLLNLDPEKDSSSQAFRNLKLDPRELGVLDTEQAYRKLVQAFSVSQDSASKATVAYELFGRQGASLVPILNAGVKALDEQKRHLEDTGQSLTQIDATNVERMNDSVTRIKDTWSGLASTIATAVAPHVERIADSFYRSEVSSGRFKRDLDGIAGIIDAIGSTGQVATDSGLLDVLFDVSMPGILINSQRLILDTIGLFKSEATAAQEAAAKEVARQKMVEQSIGEVTEKIHEEIAAIRTSGSEAEIAQLKKAGATDAELVGLRQLQAERELVNASKSITDFNDRLKEQIATFGMSAAEVAAWNAEQKALSLTSDIATDSLNQQAKALRDRANEAREYSEQLKSLEETKKSTEALNEFNRTLEDQSAKLRKSPREYADWKLEIAGVGRELRSTAMAAWDAMRADEAMSESTKKVEAAEKRRIESLKQLTESLAENAAVAGLTERQKVERDIDRLTSDPLDKTVALDLFDKGEKARKAADATKLYTDTVKELEKQIRQSGMTAEERKIDDLRVAGLNENQLKLIETLQKESALRDRIRGQVEATSVAIKAGSREAADAFARANQISVREQFLQGRLVRPDLGVTATAIPGSPVIGAAPVPVRSSSPAPIMIPQLNDLPKLIEEGNKQLERIAAKPPVVITVEEYDLV